MSTVPPAAPATDQTTGLLPCVCFAPELPGGLTLYFDEDEAIGALRADPAAECFDACGYPVAPGEQRGLPKLVATAEADPGIVLQRLLTAMRAADDRLDEEDRATLATVAAWLEDAPDLEHALHGLALADTTYNVFLDPETTNCISCNPLQRWVRGTPPCCPKP